MLKAIFDKSSKESFKVLCLGAHSDDIEIGCGGTILKLKEQYKHVEFYWVVFSSNQERAKEAKDSANAFLETAAGKKIIVKEFRDGYFPFDGARIKEFFEEIKKEISPDIVFTHYRHDRHQDHRLISDLTWNTFRDHLIMEYEILKYDGDFGSPNFFVHLDEAICTKKIECLESCFKSQDDNHWFSEETFRSVLRLRGIEANSQSQYAEAFYCRKMIF